jgi:molybdate transport system substrate-binding protein
MAMRSIGFTLANYVVAAMTIGMNAAHGAELRVMASAGMKEAVTDLVPAFEKASGHTVTIVWAGNENILGRIRGGETVDLVIMAGSNVDKLIADGKLVGESRADIARSGIGVAIRAGLPKPDISSTAALTDAVLAAKSVAYSSGPSGFYMADLFRKMGLADRIKDKVTQTPSGVQVGDIMARGEADLGFQQVSELIHVKGIEYLGPLPSDIQVIMVFSAALHAAARSPAAADALVKFLTAPEAAPVIRKAGMEPGYPFGQSTP